MSKVMVLKHESRISNSVSSTRDRSKVIIVTELVWEAGVALSSPKAVVMIPTVAAVDVPIVTWEKICILVIQVKWYSCH